jgi:hypothetical protein
MKIRIIIFNDNSNDYFWQSIHDLTTVCYDFNSTKDSYMNIDCKFLRGTE